VRNRPLTLQQSSEVLVAGRRGGHVLIRVPFNPPLQAMRPDGKMGNVDSVDLPMSIAEAEGLVVALGNAIAAAKAPVESKKDQ